MGALQSADTIPEPERWCAGLPELGARPLTQDEQDAVTTLARRQLRAWWTTLAIIAGIVSLPFVLDGHRVPDIGALAAIIGSLVAVLGFFISIGALALRARDLSRTRAGFLADLADGTVTEFGGVVPATQLPADQQALVGLGVLVAGGAGDQHIAVFAVTHNVIYRDSRGRWQALNVRVRAAAAAPAYAMRVPVPPEIAVAIDPDKELVKRSLSAAERDEIRRYIHQVKRGSLRLLFLIPYVAICVMLFLNWLHSPERSGFGLLPPSVGLVVLVRLGRRLAVVFRRTSRFSRDLATGWVFTLQPRPGPEPEVGDVVAPSAPVQEFLPRSGAVWTQNGRPASWRNLLP